MLSIKNYKWTLVSRSCTINTFSRAVSKGQRQGNKRKIETKKFPTSSISQLLIGHFWVAPSLCFKLRPSGKLLQWKWFLWASFWEWEFLELGNDILYIAYSRQLENSYNYSGQTQIAVWFTPCKVRLAPV